MTVPTDSMNEREEVIKFTIATLKIMGYLSPVKMKELIKINFPDVSNWKAERHMLDSYQRIIMEAYDK